MSPDAPYLNCDGCRSTVGRSACPTHGWQADPERAGAYAWSGSTLVMTHCIHGLDLRIHPRCYLCRPVPVGEVERLDEERLREAERFIPDAAEDALALLRRGEAARARDVLDAALRAALGEEAGRG